MIIIYTYRVNLVFMEQNMPKKSTSLKDFKKQLGLAHLESKALELLQWLEQQDSSVVLSAMQDVVNPAWRFREFDKAYDAFLKQADSDNFFKKLTESKNPNDPGGIQLGVALLKKLFTELVGHGYEVIDRKGLTEVNNLFSWANKYRPHEIEGQKLLAQAGTKLKQITFAATPVLSHFVASIIKNKNLKNDVVMGNLKSTFMELCFDVLKAPREDISFHVLETFFENMVVIQSQKPIPAKDTQPLFKAILNLRAYPILGNALSQAIENNRNNDTGKRLADEVNKLIDEKQLVKEIFNPPNRLYEILNELTIYEEVANKAHLYSTIHNLLQDGKELGKALALEIERHATKEKGLAIAKALDHINPCTPEVLKRELLNSDSKLAHALNTHTNLPKFTFFGKRGDTEGYKNLRALAEKLEPQMKEPGAELK